MPDDPQSGNQGDQGGGVATLPPLPAGYTDAPPMPVPANPYQGAQPSSMPPLPAGFSDAPPSKIVPISGFPRLQFMGQSGGRAHAGLLNDINDIADGLGFKLGISSAQRTLEHNLQVAQSGNRSRHIPGLALDISTINGVPLSSKQGKNLGDLLVTHLEQAGYSFGEHGTNKGYLWQTNIGGDHYNHIHVSLPRGFQVPPGSYASSGPGYMAQMLSDAVQMDQAGNAPSPTLPPLPPGYSSTPPSATPTPAGGQIGAAAGAAAGPIARTVTDAAKQQFGFYGRDLGAAAGAVSGATAEPVISALKASMQPPMDLRPSPASPPSNGRYTASDVIFPSSTQGKPTSLRAPATLFTDDQLQKFKMDFMNTGNLRANVPMRAADALSRNPADPTWFPRLQKMKPVAQQAILEKADELAQQAKQEFVPPQTGPEGVIGVGAVINHETGDISTLRPSEVLANLIRGPEGAKVLAQARGFAPEAEKFLYSLADPEMQLSGVGVGAIATRAPLLARGIMAGFSANAANNAMNQLREGDTGGASFNFLLALSPAILEHGIAAADRQNVRKSVGQIVEGFMSEPSLDKAQALRGAAEVASQHAASVKGDNRQWAFNYLADTLRHTADTYLRRRAISAPEKMAETAPPVVPTPTEEVMTGAVQVKGPAAQAGGTGVPGQIPQDQGVGAGNQVAAGGLQGTAGAGPAEAAVQASAPTQSQGLTVPPGTAESVLFARHGEIPDRAGKLSAPSGVTMTTAGKKQSAQAGESLKDSGADRIVSGPLQRTQQAAKIMAHVSGLPVVVNNEFEPLDIGDALRTQPDNDANKAIIRQHVENPDQAFPGGESVQQWIDKIIPAYQKVRAEGGTPVLVTNSTVQRAIRAWKAAGEPMNPIRLDPNVFMQDAPDMGTVSRLAHDGQQWDYQKASGAVAAQPDVHVGGTAPEARPAPAGVTVPEGARYEGIVDGEHVIRRADGSEYRVNAVAAPSSAATTTPPDSAKGGLSAGQPSGGAPVVGDKVWWKDEKGQVYAGKVVHPASASEPYVMLNKGPAGSRRWSLKGNNWNIGEPPTPKPAEPPAPTPAAAKPAETPPVKQGEAPKAESAPEPPRPTGEKAESAGAESKTKPAEEYGAQNKVFTRDAYEEAVNRLKDKLNRLSAGIDPTILKDLVEIGGYHVEAGIRTFAEWAKRMRADLGHEISDENLHAAWNEIGKRVPTEEITREAKPEGDDTASRNASVNRDLERLGLPPLNPHTPQSHIETLAKAFDQGLHTEEHIRGTIDEMRSRPRGLSAEETAGLDIRLQQIKNRLPALEEATSTLTGSREILRAGSERERLLKEFASIAEIDKKSGTMQGRALESRKLTIDDKMSLKAVVGRAVMAKGSSINSAEVESLRAKVAEYEKAEQDRAAKEQEKKAADAAYENQRAQSAVEELTREGQKATRKLNRTAARGEFKAELKGLADEWRALRSRPGKPTSRQSGAVRLPAEEAGIVVRMAKVLISHGVREIGALVSEIHETAKDVIEGITHSDIRRAISRYGETTKPNPEENAATLREMKAQMLKIEQLEDAQKGQRPLKTGFQRDAQSAEVRRLTAEVNETMRKQGIANTRSTAEGLKSAMDAVKTRLKNQITDLNRYIDTKTKKPEQTKIAYDAEANALKVERDRLQGVYDNLNKGDIDQSKIRTAIGATQRSIADLQKRIQSGDIEGAKTASSPWSAELGQLKQQQVKLREQMAALRKTARDAVKGSPEQRKIESSLRATVKANAELNRRIQVGDIEGKKQTVAVWSKELGQAKLEHAALLSQLQEMRKATAEPVKMTDEQRLAQAKRMTAKSIAELERQLRERDFQKKARPPGPVDEELAQARSKRDALRDQVNAEILMMQPVSFTQKILAIRRAGLITAPRIIAKVLVSHGIYLGAEEVRKIPSAVVDALVATKAGSSIVGSVPGRRAAFAPRLGEVAQAGYKAATQGISEAAAIARHGETKAQERTGMQPIGSTSTGLHLAPSTGTAIGDAYVEAASRAHSAAYRPFKLAAFERARQELARVYPHMDAEAISAMAATEAEAAVFLNKNKLSTGMRAFTASMRGKERKGPAALPGHIAANVLDFVFPVQTVPVNIVARMLEYTPVGMVYEAAKVYARKQVGETMSLEEQRNFSRTFGRGLVGLGIIALGAYMRSKGQAVGYPEDWKERENLKRKGWAAPGVKVGRRSYETQTINPIGTLFAIGASLSDAVTGKTDPLHPVAESLRELPYLHAAQDWGEIGSSQGAKFLAGSSIGSFVPTFIADIAAQMDEKERRRQTVMDYVKARVPRLRQKLKPKSIPQTSELFDPFNSRIVRGSPERAESKVPPELRDLRRDMRDMREEAKAGQ
jgi:broad specificity phosphatase PhoE